MTMIHRMTIPSSQGRYAFPPQTHCLALCLGVLTALLAGASGAWASPGSGAALDAASGVAVAKREARRPDSPAQADYAEQEAGSSDASTARVDIAKDPSGNYFTTGQINDTIVRLLVDTGASTVVIPARLAKRMGLQQGESLTFKTGGGPVPHYMTKLDSLVIGPIQIRDVPAAINPSMNEEFVLLGMSALELLHWTQREGHLSLSYQAPTGSPGTSGAAEPTARFKKPLRECMGEGRSIDRKTLECLNGRGSPP